MQQPVLLTFETAEFPHAKLAAAVASRLSASSARPAPKVDTLVKIAAASARRNAHLLGVKAKALRVSKRVDQVRRARVMFARHYRIACLTREAEAGLRRYLMTRNTLLRLGHHHATVALAHDAKAEGDELALHALEARIQSKLSLSTMRRDTLLTRRVQNASAVVAKAHSVATAAAEKALAELERKKAQLTVRLDAAATRRSERLLSTSPAGKTMRSPAAAKPEEAASPACC